MEEDTQTRDEVVDDSWEELVDGYLQARTHSDHITEVIGAYLRGGHIAIVGSSVLQIFHLRVEEDSDIDIVITTSSDMVISSLVQDLCADTHYQASYTAFKDPLRDPSSYSRLKRDVQTLIYLRDPRDPRDRLPDIQIIIPRPKYRGNVKDFHKQFDFISLRGIVWARDDGKVLLSFDDSVDLDLLNKKVLQINFEQIEKQNEYEWSRSMMRVQKYLERGWSIPPDQFSLYIAMFAQICQKITQFGTKYIDEMMEVFFTRIVDNRIDKVLSIRPSKWGFTIQSPLIEFDIFNPYSSEPIVTDLPSEGWDIYLTETISTESIESIVFIFDHQVTVYPNIKLVMDSSTMFTPCFTGMDTEWGRTLGQPRIISIPLMNGTVTVPLGMFRRSQHKSRFMQIGEEIKKYPITMSETAAYDMVGTNHCQKGSEKIVHFIHSVIPPVEFDHDNVSLETLEPDEEHF